MNRTLATPLTKLLELNLALDLLAILAAPVVDPFALLTGQSDQVVLGHGYQLNILAE